MKTLSKRSISRFLYTHCQRQLGLGLIPTTGDDHRAERDAAGMPPPQEVRAGKALRSQGRDWERAKYAELTSAYGPLDLVVAVQSTASGSTTWIAQPLIPALMQATAGQMLFEAEFQVEAEFERALGIEYYKDRYGLTYTSLRSDILQVLAPGTYDRALNPDGTIEHLEPGDPRLQLRIIDIKSMHEPSIGHAGEVAYYAMVIAAVLRALGLYQRFCVVAGALWVGSHEISSLARTHQNLIRSGSSPTLAELDQALEDDLEPIELEVLALRLRRFFQEELAAVLAKPWDELPFHITPACAHCEYLGASSAASAPHPNHCMPLTARASGLNLIADLAVGARRELEQGGIRTLAELASLNVADPVLDRHQALKAQRGMLPARAFALQQWEELIDPHGGTSAVLPQEANLSLVVRQSSIEG